MGTLLGTRQDNRGAVDEIKNQKRHLAHPDGLAPRARPQIGGWLLESLPEIRHLGQIDHRSYVSNISMTTNGTEPLAVFRDRDGHSSSSLAVRDAHPRPGVNRWSVQHHEFAGTDADQR
jgi:hypothetical protein